VPDRTRAATAPPESAFSDPVESSNDNQSSLNTTARPKTQGGDPR
jgi:hypothetical protein